MTIARVLPILLVLLPFGAAGQPVTVALTDQAVPAEFIERVNAYAEIHRIATAPLGPATMCSDPEQLVRQKLAFANALRRGRPNAREGDIFTPTAATYFRTLIKVVAYERGFDVVAELEDEQGERIPNGAVVQVNEAFPWNAGAVMWPSMLWSLPELPPELEYRFVGRDLVLVDALGGIVVDVLRDALPVDGLLSRL